ncbi:IS1096 element passenger TnpR family protein, partial [Thermanaeromonas sp.]|uniref:IS1096 element passenger TnpR family protein n=1 Tax=Thermanaeromonas sp. TaxID=2003697 RepID=UPI003D1621D8
CGGPWGYQRMLKILSDPEHEEYEETVEWLGGEFDPEAFDLEEINRRLWRIRLK